MNSPIKTKVSEDKFLILNETGSFKIPNFLLPKTLHNKGNYVISLGETVKWLAEQAEELGVNIYPGFPAD